MIDRYCLDNHARIEFFTLSDFASSHLLRTIITVVKIVITALIAVRMLIFDAFRISE